VYYFVNQKNSSIFAASKIKPQGLLKKHPCGFNFLKYERTL